MRGREGQTGDLFGWVFNLDSTDFVPLEVGSCRFGSPILNYFNYYYKIIIVDTSLRHDT